jgi:hypothetical protein
MGASREQVRHVEAHLGGRGDRVVMAFDEIADLVGGLPASARDYEAWWNKYDSTQSQCKAWIDTGYLAHPQLTVLRVTFTLEPRNSTARSPGTPGRLVRHRADRL